MANHLQKLLKLRSVKGNEACEGAVTDLGDTLAYTFGLDLEHPSEEPNLDAGYENARRMLDQVCEAFADPTHIVRAAPFAYAFLGTEDFYRGLDVVLARAASHSDEQPLLDEVLSGATLVRPERRQAFFDSVSQAGSLDDEVFGVGLYVSEADPAARFTTADEFPAEFRTSDIVSALGLMDIFLELGVFRPGQGFTKEYAGVLAKMGSLDFMLKDPSAENVVVISPKKGFLPAVEGMNYEYTPEFDARPNNSGENPSVVVVNAAVPLKDVQRWYGKSTILYGAGNRKQRAAIAQTLGDDAGALMIGPKTFEQYLKYISSHRTQGHTDLREMLAADLGKARELAESGNEHFYDVRDTFDNLGRREVVDAMVAEGGFRLPPRTDYKLVMLYTDHPDEMTGFFDGASNKKLRAFTKLPTLEDTGPPFAIITNLAVPKQDILDQYPNATVLYVVRNSKEENAIQRANPEDLVVNAAYVEKVGEYRGKSGVGRSVVEMFFDAIAESRGKGVTDMNDIARGISEKIKEIRDTLLFATNLRSYWNVADDYHDLQERYKPVPIVAQLTDTALMMTCPTGGCFKMKGARSYGCGRSNVPEILIDFAAAYRKQVGEDQFKQELEAHHKGKLKAPWYIDMRGYGRFPSLTGKQKRRRMTF